MKNLLIANALRLLCCVVFLGLSHVPVFAGEQGSEGGNGGGGDADYYNQEDAAFLKKIMKGEVSDLADQKDWSGFGVHLQREQCTQAGLTYYVLPTQWSDRIRVKLNVGTQVDFSPEAVCKDRRILFAYNWFAFNLSHFFDRDKTGSYLLTKDAELAGPVTWVIEPETTQVKARQGKLREFSWFAPKTGMIHFAARSYKRFEFVPAFLKHELMHALQLRAKISFPESDEHGVSEKLKKLCARYELNSDYRKKCFAQSRTNEKTAFLEGLSFAIEDAHPSLESSWFGQIIKDDELKGFVDAIHFGIDRKTPFITDSALRWINHSAEYDRKFLFFEKKLDKSSKESKYCFIHNGFRENFFNDGLNPDSASSGDPFVINARGQKPEVQSYADSEVYVAEAITRLFNEAYSAHTQGVSTARRYGYYNATQVNTTQREPGERAVIDTIVSRSPQNLADLAKAYDEIKGGDRGYRWLRQYFFYDYKKGKNISDEYIIDLNDSTCRIALDEKGYRQSFQQLIEDEFIRSENEDFEIRARSISDERVDQWIQSSITQYESDARLMSNVGSDLNALDSQSRKIALNFKDIRNQKQYGRPNYYSIDDLIKDLQPDFFNKVDSNVFATVKEYLLLSEKTGNIDLDYCGQGGDLPSCTSLTTYDRYLVAKHKLLSLVQNRKAGELSHLEYVNQVYPLMVQLNYNGSAFHAFLVLVDTFGIHD